MILNRIWSRVKRHGQSITTTCLLSVVTPDENATIATLNSYEENAAAALCELDFQKYKKVYVLSPEPEILKKNIELTAKSLNVHPNMSKVHFLELNYKNLLLSFTKSLDTFVTHVLLPGMDLGGRRRHAHLTHGSGMKRELAFKSPLNVLYATTEPYIQHQIREYHLPQNVEVVRHQPRLSISAHTHTNSDRAREVLDWCNSEKVALWVPTYRQSTKQRNDQQIAGEKLGNPDDALFFNSIIEKLVENGYRVLLKSHSIDLDTYALYNVPQITNRDLQSAGILFYELLAASDLIITDYSSVYYEALQLGKPVVTWKPDAKEFEQSYRGFRDVSLLPLGLEDPDFCRSFINRL